MGTVTVSVDEVRGLCVDALTAAGLERSEAEIVASHYVETEAAGRASHGLAGLPVALGDAARRGEATIQVDSPALTVIDGNGEMGHLIAERYVPTLARKAAAAGVAVLAIGNVSRVASPATIARMLAAKRLASLCFEYGGQAFVAAPGNTEPSVSTNPIAIGFPRPHGHPPMLDMATSARAFFFVKLAETLGTSIPSDWALDSAGRPVEDPASAHTLAPVGGYKGFGLSFMLELLTGPMLGVASGRRGTLGTRGLLAIALDPEAFGRTLDEIDSDVAALIEDLDGAAYPGQASGERIARMRETGELAVEEATLAQLRDLARGR